MGRDGDGDGAVEERRIYVLWVWGVSWSFHMLCSMFLVASTLLIYMLFRPFNYCKIHFLYINRKSAVSCPVHDRPGAA